MKRKSIKKSREVNLELENCKVISLTRGEYALVDQEDWAILKELPWWLDCTKTVGLKYACTTMPSKTAKCGRKTVRMHTVIGQRMGIVEQPGYCIHHKNGNGLDNRRSNLEQVTRKRNTQIRFRSTRKTNKDIKYMGVYRQTKVSDSYFAMICMNGYRKYLGTFPTQEEASIAYQVALAKFNRSEEKKQNDSKE